jgi:UDP:flavonoid glycosyltransferase YjiC (YdhE family)
LFIAEAASLAHVARPVQLARRLDPNRYEVHLAWDDRFAPLFGPLPFPQHSIQSISCEQFLQALAKGAPLYDARTLRDYIYREMALLDAIQPDAVVGDFRISLAITTRLQAVPYLALANAYWSPYASVRYTVPDHPMVKLLGVKLAQRVFNLARPMAFALHCLPMRKIRREFRVPGPSLKWEFDLRRLYTEGDWTLYADIPQLAPLHEMPQNHVYLGPIPWSPDMPMPAWWHELDDSRPILYATPGSTGRRGMLATVLEALAPLDLTVMAASAGQELAGPAPANARVERYLPGLEAAARSALTICNGGSPTTYQALAAGKPVLGLATNLDQFLNMRGIEDAGAGLTLRADRLTAAGVRKAVERLLGDPAFTTAAARIGRSCQQYDSAAVLASVLDRAMDPSAEPAPPALETVAHELPL